MDTSQAVALGHWPLTSDPEPHEDPQSLGSATPPDPPLEFEEIYRRLREPVLRWATRCLRNRQDAEDIVGEAFEALRKALPGIQSRAEKSVDAYFFRIVKNLIIRPRRQTELLHEDAVQAEVPEEEPLWLTTTEDELQTAIARLPESDRELIILALRDRLSHRAIASRLGLPSANAVAIRLCRAKKALRALVQEELARRHRDRSSHA